VGDPDVLHAYLHLSNLEGRLWQRVGKIEETGMYVAIESTKLVFSALVYS